MTEPLRLSAPRIPPLPEAEWTPEQREMLLSARNPLGPLNIFRTLVRDPELYRRYNKFAHRLLFKSSLSPRIRELAILRAGWTCGSAYEFHQHTAIGKAAGLSDAEIERVRQAADAPGWTPLERAVLRAADELRRDSIVGDSTWRTLREHYDETQLIELLFLIGSYNMLAMVLNSTGVQIESAPSGGDAG